MAKIGIGFLSWERALGMANRYARASGRRHSVRGRRDARHETYRWYVREVS